MIKLTPKRYVLFGLLLQLLAVAAAVISYAQSAQWWGRGYLYAAAAVVMVLGAGAFMWGVRGLAIGQDWVSEQKTSRVMLWVRKNRTKVLAASTVVLGLVFAVLTAISLTLPKPKGTHFVPVHEAIRLSALISSVLFLVGIMSLVLPVIINALEGRGFVSFVGTRHVRAAKSGFLTVISILSISGVAVSSCALVSVSSIMGGFGADLQRKILGNNPHITVDVQDQEGFADWNEVLERVAEVPGVAGVTPAVSGEAMASSATNTAGCMVRGVEASTVGSVIDLLKNIEVGKFSYLVEPVQLTKLPPGEVIGLGPGGEPFTKGPDIGSSFYRGTEPVDPQVAEVLREPDVYPGLIVGRELAKSLHVYVGDEVTLISPLGDLGPMGVMPRVRKFRVAAIYYSGMYEYDASQAFVLIDQAQELFSTGTNVTSIDVRAEDGQRVSQLLPDVKQAVNRSELRVRDWREMNKNLFSALKLERIATFIILSLAIAVASFCIICTLLLMVTEKGQQIAVLKSLGASNGAIMRIFMLEGVMIGGIGTVFGVVTGVAISLGLSLYGLRLSPEVYYIDRLPIAIDWVDYLLVAISAMVICTVATIYPAHAASRLRPVESLRHE